MPTPTYYDTLGIASTATAEEIKAAYRRLARKYHPDRNKEADAEARFKEVGQAYDTLSDEQKRRAYDFEQRLGNGSGGRGPYEFNWGRDDGFSDLFRRQKANRKSAHYAFLKVSADLAIQGGRMKVDLEGEQVTIKVPPYSEEGDSIAITTPAGEEWFLTVEIEDERTAKEDHTGRWSGQWWDNWEAQRNKSSSEGVFDDRFQTDGKNLFYTATVPAWTLALGGFVNVPTLTGEVRIRVPEGFQAGAQLRVKGKGHKEGGDLLVKLLASAPRPTTAAQRQAYEALANAFPAD